MNETMSQTIKAGGYNLHYLACGQGEPILFLHGWPTSSYLWREVLPIVAAAGHRAIALDLPGFGRSDKPLDASYSFRFYSQIIDDFLTAIEVDKLGLAVHDLGGPVGLYWACQNQSRITKLALTNTLVYPEFSWAVIAFGVALRLPFMRRYLSSPKGLRSAMRIGVHRPDQLDPAVIAAVQEPFQSAEARQALIKSGLNLHPDGFKEIATKLTEFTIPVCAVYGEHDRILPDVAQTMRRVAADLPQTQITSLPNCGHFLQEECAGELGQHLAAFFAENGSADI